MNKRDKAILESLRKFRVLDRDQLIELHFNNLKQKLVTCNRVMKRLRDRKYVDCDTTAVPFNYFPNPTTMRKDSMKLLHFKAITDFYIEAMKLGKVSMFEVEYRTGEKGFPEVDLFMIWNGAPFYVEIQRNVYTKKVMDAKLNRYKAYYDEGSWKSEHWQRQQKFFPYILIITDHTYTLDKPPLKIFQAKNMKEFVKSIN